jgi:hypothetical protein
MKTKFFLILLSLLLLILSCDESKNLVFDGSDGSEPIKGSITLPEEDIISPSTVFLISFTEEVDISTLEISGTIAGEDKTETWNEAKTELSIAPVSAWTEKAHTLIVTVRGVDGYFVTVNGSWNTENTPLTMESINVADNSIISSSERIKITFSNSISTLSTVITGGMSAEALIPLWSQTASINDTMEIIPKTAWSSGSDKTILLTVTDITGTSLLISLSYNIVGGIVYVSPTGDDAALGTITKPKKSLQAAIDLAASIQSASEVHVQEGTYEVNNDADPLTPDRIIIKNGVTLKGGYSNSDIDWNTRDIVNTPSIIEDESLSKNVTVKFKKGSINAGIDGFTINSSQTDGPVPDNANYPIINSTTTAIFLENVTNVTINNCNINLRILNGITREAVYVSASQNVKIRNITSTNGQIRIFMSSFLIEYNTIASYTIKFSTDEGIIRNNIIGYFFDSNCEFNLSYKSTNIIIENNLIIYNTNIDDKVLILFWFDPDDVNIGDNDRIIIRNNTLYTKNTEVSGITFLTIYKKTVYLENNILYGKEGSNPQGITTNVEMDNIFLSLKNNCIYFSKIANNAGTPLSLGQLNDKSYADANVIDDPLFVIPVAGDDGLLSTMDDNNFTLQVETANSSVRTGGIDGTSSWDFSTDITGAIRTGNGTTGWSMGAYEKD